MLNVLFEVENNFDAVVTMMMVWVLRKKLCSRCIGICFDDMF